MTDLVQTAMFVAESLSLETNVKLCREIKNLDLQQRFFVTSSRIDGYDQEPKGVGKMAVSRVEKVIKHYLARNSRRNMINRRMLISS